MSYMYSILFLKAIKYLAGEEEDCLLKLFKESALDTLAQDDGNAAFVSGSASVSVRVVRPANARQIEICVRLGVVLFVVVVIFCVDSHFNVGL